MDESAQTGAVSAPGNGVRVWDTAQVSAGEAFGYYREGICEAFMELAPEAETWRRRHFRARVKSVPFSGGALNEVRATSHLVCRTRGEIARSPEECYYLNLQLDGECRIEQSGGEVVLRPGDLGIFDSGIPFRLEHRSRPVLGVASYFVPKTLLDRRLGAGGSSVPKLVSAHPLFGRLATDTAATLAQSHDFMTRLEGSRLFETLVDLTALALGGEAGNLPATGRHARYHAIRRLITENHHDPGFDVTACAARAGISKRYLQQLLAENGDSFRGLLMDERMRRAEAMLRAPDCAHLPVTEIAFRAGFSDLSYFNRVFRKRRDCSPGGWRRTGH